jgi:hypothetical protein
METAKSSYKQATTKKTAKQLKDENFRRQEKTFIKKGDRLRKLNANVFILLRRKGKLTIYTSRDRLDDPLWPLQ